MKFIFGLLRILMLSIPMDMLKFFVTTFGYHMGTSMIDWGYLDVFV